MTYFILTFLIGFLLGALVMLYACARVVSKIKAREDFFYEELLKQSERRRQAETELARQNSWSWLNAWRKSRSQDETVSL